MRLRSSFLILGLLCVSLAPRAAPGQLTLNPEQIRLAGVATALPVAVAASAAAPAALRLHGSVVAPPQATELVSAPLGGVVQAVLVSAADGVRAGQPVLRLHSPALMGAQREYLQLRLQAEQAADRLKRDEQLAGEGIIAEARLRETRNAEQQARVAAEERRQSLRLAGLGDAQLKTLVSQLAVQPVLTVAAAANGRVAEVMVQPGQQVEAGAPLLKLARPLPLSLALQATREQATRLRTGARVQLDGCALGGRVRGLVPTLQGSNQAVIVQVALDRAADCAQPNQAVSAEVDGVALAAGALRVPAAALLRLDGQDQVFVRQGNSFRPQPVQLVSREADVATVSGLAADSQVVVHGVAALKGAWAGLGDTQPAAVPARPAAAASAASAGGR